MKSALTAALLSAALLGACSSTPTAEPAAAAAPASGPTAADLARLDTLVGYMTGSFDSAEQAAADKSYFDIRLHMTPIWTDRPADADKARWLYVEQAMADQLAKPYRQRIYRVTALGNGRFKSEVNELPGNPLDLAGAWKTPDLFNNLKAEDLVARDGCYLILTDRKESFAGSTHERDCLSNFRGAAYTTSEATFTQDTLISWDRGFDSEDKQVWGATKGGYIFRKRSR